VLIRMTNGNASSVLAYYAPRGVGFPCGPSSEASSASSAEVQARRHLRANHAVHSLRGGASTSIQFSARIELASMAEAQRHFFLHPVEVVRDHTLEVVLNSDSAVVYRNAVLVGVSGSRAGVSVTWTYSIVAGEAALAEALVDSEGSPLVDDQGDPLFTEAE